MYSYLIGYHKSLITPNTTIILSKNVANVYIIVVRLSGTESWDNIRLNRIG